MTICVSVDSVPIPKNARYFARLLINATLVWRGAIHFAGQCYLGYNFFGTFVKVSSPSHNLPVLGEV